MKNHATSVLQVDASTRQPAAVRDPAPAGPARPRPPGRQAGFTLVELMVAMVIGLVISIAAVAALVVARTGFTSVDTTAQLRENGRFVSDLMQRVIVQAGFEDDSQRNGSRFLAATKNNEDPEPDIVGYNNAVFPAAPGFPPAVLNDSRSSACGSVTDSSCANGSDVLVVRYQGMNTPGTTTADGSMINCAGIPEPAITDSTDSRAFSVFHVASAPQSGEPVLMCSYRSAGAWVTQPLIQGVESFQVLYGTDSVTINAAPPATAVPPAVTASAPDSVPDRYLRADQIIVPGNAAATRANWRRVRSVRVGLVLRGPVNSKFSRADSTNTYYPFGLTPTLPTAPAPNTDVIVSSSADVGSALTIPQDGRLRLDGLNFTVYLRNRLLND